MSLSSQTEVTPNKNSVEASLCLQPNPKVICGKRRGTRTPINDDKNGIFQLSLCFHYTNLLFVFICANMIKVIHIGFSELSLLTRLQRFHQCLHRRFFIPM